MTTYILAITNNCLIRLNIFSSGGTSCLGLETASYSELTRSCISEGIYHYYFLGERCIFNCILNIAYFYAYRLVQLSSLMKKISSLLNRQISLQKSKTTQEAKINLPQGTNPQQTHYTASIPKVCSITEVGVKRL